MSKRVFPKSPPLSLMAVFPFEVAASCLIRSLGSCESAYDLVITQCTIHVDDGDSGGRTALHTCAIATGLAELHAGMKRMFQKTVLISETGRELIVQLVANRPIAFWQLCGP